MPDGLRELLVMVAICVPVGLAIGIALRKLGPGLCKVYAKFLMNGHWWIYALGAALFAVMATASFASGRSYRGAFFLTFFVLEVFAFFFYGFRRLTPEMEKKIDASDPTRLWPINFTKQKKAD